MYALLVSILWRWFCNEVLSVHSGYAVILLWKTALLPLCFEIVLLLLFVFLFLSVRCGRLDIGVWLWYSTSRSYFLASLRNKKRSFIEEDNSHYRYLCSEIELWYNLHRLLPGRGYSQFFFIRRHGPSIHYSPPKLSGTSGIPPEIFEM